MLSDSVGKIAYLSGRDDSMKDAQYCTVLDGRTVPTKPVEFEIIQGSLIRDFAGNDRSMLIVSEKVLSLFVTSGFSGWREYPVRLFGRDGKGIRAKYHGLSVIGRTGRLDSRRSVTKWYNCRDGRKTIAGIRGLYFDVRQWDGSDIFMFKDNDVGGVIVTKRVIAALKTSKSTGWESVPVLKFTMGVQNP